MASRESNDTNLTASSKEPSPRRPLSGAILIGGQSRRMGTPKAELKIAGRRLIDIAIDLLHPFVHALALVGHYASALQLQGAGPHKGKSIVRLEDDPATTGPLAGIAALFSHQPDADWLVIPCDMPALTPQSIDWLLTAARGSATPTVGVLPGSPEPEPFPAVLPSTCAPACRAHIATGNRSLRSALAAMNARVIPIPESLAPCWPNCNTPEEFSRLTGEIS